ncbi:MAG: hypothetical protein HOW73_36845 [Polyangiaceae bacterium]|nr:hypothetical protein [Polyangiaceae bacterium]
MTTRAIGWLVMALCLSASGCESGATDESASGGGNPCGGPSPEERAQNQKIFDGLAPTCEGCHTSGSRGYFASIEAFEGLLAYNPSLVVPGAPDDSELVRLLEGNGTRAFTQMPISGPSYAGLVEEGGASLSMTEIRAWVTNLAPHTVDRLPSIDAPRIARLGADDVVRALYQQLGLSDADFFTDAMNHSVLHKTSLGDGNYPITSSDWAPAPFEGLPAERHQSLGGGSALYQVKGDTSISPSFLGTLTQVAQRWCAKGLDKPGNEALLPPGASIEVGSSDPAQVKSIIASWFLHFHAVEATQGDIDDVYDNVFVPLEAGATPRIGYVGTCSYFIRHPDWIFY